MLRVAEQEEGQYKGVACACACPCMLMSVCVHSGLVQEG